MGVGVAADLRPGVLVGRLVGGEVGGRRRRRPRRGGRRAGRSRRPRAVTIAMPPKELGGIAGICTPPTPRRQGGKRAASPARSRSWVRAPRWRRPPVRGRRRTARGSAARGCCRAPAPPACPRRSHAPSATSRLKTGCVPAVLDGRHPGHPAEGPDRVAGLEVAGHDPALAGLPEAVDAGGDDRLVAERDPERPAGRVVDRRPGRAGSSGAGAGVLGEDLVADLDRPRWPRIPSRVRTGVPAPKQERTADVRTVTSGRGAKGTATNWSSVGLVRTPLRREAVTLLVHPPRLPGLAVLAHSPGR